MQKNSDNFSIQKAMNMVKNPAGKQLIELLQQLDRQRLDEAAALASQGKYSEAQKHLSGLLSDPQVQALLSQLGE